MDKPERNHKSRLTRRSQWVVATLAQGCLQQFQNVTFFDCIELTARPFKRSKKSAVFAAEDSQGSHGATNHLFIRELLDRIVLRRPSEPARQIRSWLLDKGQGTLAVSEQVRRPGIAPRRNSIVVDDSHRRNEGRTRNAADLNPSHSACSSR